MARARKYPPDHPAFADLPVRNITIGAGRDQMAVHIAGRLGGRVPVICVPGYHRNMADYSDFARYFGRLAGENWPLLLVDLFGRGRSTDREDKTHYASPRDAADLIELTTALGIERAVFVGQGYGGQVIMALATQKPNLPAGAVLIDAGPVSDPRGLVRLRINLAHMGEWKGSAARLGMRRILASDYPGLVDTRLDQLALRAHYFDRRGRARGLFDPHLAKMLEAFDTDDVLVAQWPMFETLRHAPLMFMRSQLTDQLRRDTFEEMIRRRPEAPALIISGQGSPALLDDVEEVRAIVSFIEDVAARRRQAA